MSANEKATQSLAQDRPDPEGVAASYKHGVKIRKQLVALVHESYGPEYPYIRDALQAIEGRLHAQYAYVSDSGNSEACAVVASAI